VGQHDHLGRARLYQADGADAGDVSYSITLEGDDLVSGRVSTGTLPATPPAVPDSMVNSERDRPYYLRLDDGRWISFRIENAAGELERSGGIVAAPTWAPRAHA
jgi:hypothetical protein